ncbi:4'-phosphopantetheinyl transferase superfamily protein [Flavobacterium sp. I-SCBP12n]|uniref:4'-phosphopantetheinyl transferase superfamily protein n=1 Tax=Flavobacterium pygoscelis TaxID=2893176 RepID=A0A9X1XRK5_9FLAO|nr:4'-phosphopantetheinyl transferase superfamily protein [Flavobacterium pygoscelis]MCK8142235.1 4'-phosphopantetheinyl transferase superfamily protein [Flavobacterium pygoscelis]
MPLFKTISFNSTTQILVWKITESYQELLDTVVLNEKNSIRLAGMKSPLHQRAFLSVRKLFHLAGYTDFDLYYDEFGKPHLKDGKHISITHSHEFSAIILSDETVGIDMELQRDKIIKIADKFCDSEFQYLIDNEEYIRKLTVIWGAKEAIFKIRNEKGISFKNHIKVNAFDLETKEAISELHFDRLIKNFKIYFEEIEGFTLVYAFQLNV